MYALVGRSYDKVSCVALSMANPDLKVRLGGYAAARLAATTKPLVLLESCLQTLMTYTSAQCTVNELLMMSRGTARNM